MARKSETITLSIQKGTKEKLERIAEKLGLLWGDRPSISGLLNALATDEIYAGRPFELTKNQERALESAVKLLIDSSNLEFANTIVELLLERGNLETPMRNQLINQILHDFEGWRKAIDFHLSEQKPFLLHYQNSQGEQELLNVCYGEIRFREKRYYLEAWCEETLPEPEIPELTHNRCFRLDERIKNILKSNSRWRKEGLDFIPVQLHFYGGMIKAYERKLEDIDVEEKEDKLVVIRKVDNPFWFVREILPYGKNCEIISPEKVRDRYIEQLKNIVELYKLVLEIPKK